MSYVTTIASVGGNDAMLVKSFIIACEGATLNLFARLPPNSIFSWERLKLKVIDSFQGLSKPSLTSSDLFNCKQADGDTLTS